MKVVNNTNEFNNEISTGNVCLKFSAEWCGPCRVLSSLIETIEDNYENVNFVEVDVDDIDEEILNEYKVRNIPMLYFIKDGVVLNKFVGSVNKEILETELAKYE